MKRFAAAVIMLSYDHGEESKEYEIEHHGSGVFVLFRKKLFFLCAKHSFHGGDVSKPKLEDYDSLCFFTPPNISHKPKMIRVCPTVLNKESAHVPQEDILFYEIYPEGWKYYDKYRSAASVIDSRKAFGALKKKGFMAFVCGFSNQFGGNTDYDKHTIHQEHKGRYVKIDLRQPDLNMLQGTIDVSGFVDHPTKKGEFNLNGMSGGGLFTCGEDETPLFLGMCLAGTAVSRRIHFLSVTYIEHMLGEYLEQPQKL